MTINGFEKKESGGGPSECDAKFHSDNTLIVALSSQWYNHGNRCFKFINIHYKDRSVKARVVDECDSSRGCKDDIVDASKAVWMALQVPKREWGEAKVTCEMDDDGWPTGRRMADGRLPQRQEGEGAGRAKAVERMVVSISDISTTAESLIASTFNFKIDRCSHPLKSLYRSNPLSPPSAPSVLPLWTIAGLPVAPLPRRQPRPPSAPSPTSIQTLG
ncbi:hypothetical protein E3N88_32773 [Mikania micrantha]|uniref:Barwin domain-containing protein n=1 Tax=Mikania micrantha TaxID=192012 RepID=A0A5N6MA42_9ASTR|nr:hypothetical protein E3N88_32773 [Mikania micrantha]